MINVKRCMFDNVLMCGDDIYCDVCMICCLHKAILPLVVSS